MSLHPLGVWREEEWKWAIQFSKVFSTDNDNIVYPGFKKRVDKYLGIADKHHIRTIFIFFDDCWNKVPVAGKHPAPKPGIRNSRPALFLKRLE